MPRVGVLTVSDRCASGEAEDRSGPALVAAIAAAAEQLGLSAEDVESVAAAVVPDDVEAIQRVVRRWCDEEHRQLILTTGGTGFTPRDQTPEAIRPLLEREAPALAAHMVQRSLEVTPFALLSRPVCGTRKGSLILTLPGSSKGCVECLGFVQPVLRHALDQLANKRACVAATHRAMRQTDTNAHSKHSGHTHDHEHAHDHHHHHHHHHKHGDGTHGKYKTHRQDLSSSSSGGAAAAGSVADRPRTSTYPMVQMAEATSMALAATPRLLPEEVNTAELPDLDGLLHRFLAADVCASEQFPPFPASVKDGYAVCAADGAADLEVLGAITAGDDAAGDDSAALRTVVPGTAARITTGAPIPPGADAVVQVEDTDLLERTADGQEEKRIRVVVAPMAGQDIRPAGCDIKPGEVVLPRGARIGPPELGLLACLGLPRIMLVRKPVVGVLSTGDEVADHRAAGRDPAALGYGRIFDSNRPMLLTAAKQAGADTVDLGIARDSREALRTALQEGLAKCDVLITSGGVSMGEKDLLKALLLELGGTIHFGRIFMKPGKPTTFATVPSGEHTRLVFALPGNPVSCAVTFQLFVRPSLAKMRGDPAPKLPEIRVKLGFEARLDPRLEYHRAVIEWDAAQDLPVAHSTGVQRSSRLLSMRSANALLVLPPRSDTTSVLPAGTPVTALLIE